MPQLSVKGVSIRFGGILALDRVSFDVAEGEIKGLIGPNGAGKTTMFNCISRLYQPYEGEILYGDINILKLAPHQVIGAGIVRTFQNVELFKTMSVLDNVMVGWHSKMTIDFLRQAFWVPGVGKEEREARERAHGILDYLDLGYAASRQAGGFPFAIQKRIELARALVSGPSFLMLDEPASGLNREEIGELVGVIKRVRDDLKVTVLVVEHHMDLVMKVSDSVVVLDFGRWIADGTPGEVQTNKAVVEAYLGAEHHAIA